MITSRPLENTPGRGDVNCNVCGAQDLKEYYRCTTCLSGRREVCENCMKEGRACLDGPHPTSKLYASITIDIEATKADIQTYIEYRIKNEPSLINVCCKKQELRTKISEVVLNTVGVMFLAVKLLMDLLRGKRTSNAVTETLNTMPKSLEGIYEGTMQRIEQNSPDDAILAKRILSWVVWSRRALHVGELLQALAVRSGDHDFDPGEILDEGVISFVTAGSVVADNEGCVRLVHLTVQSYFERNKDRWLPDASVEIAMTTVKFKSQVYWDISDTRDIKGTGGSLH